MDNKNPRPSKSLETKLVTGLSRVGTSLRSESWSKSLKESLNPTQMQIISLMASSSDPTSVSALSERLGVTKATLSDSVKALCEKKLVRKEISTEDRRGVKLFLTAKGKKTSENLSSWSNDFIGGMDLLTPEEKAQLLLLVSKLIRGLQEKGRIAPHKMCVSCVHFDPNKYPGSNTPHHCHFVNAAFGSADLRMDCGEFESEKKSAG